MSNVNAANRAGLLVVGLLLTAAGVLGLVLGYGGFGAEQTGRPVLPLAWRERVALDPWWWWVVAGVALLVALLGLWWLLAQLRTDRVGRLELPPGGRDGRTVLHAGALCDAVEADARTVAGVDGASARLSGERRHRLQLAVDLADRANVAEVWRDLTDQTVPRARRVAGDPGLPIDVELRPSRRAGARVA
ncbi:hypothetical protein [Puerhibacterium sp. TATVAM-FAB25]|uniref:hypothetical protein n=1 Tax=Puerhibacterium sp. TATVAM-FAB25 TaxID=3093699 RepID=UPI00397ABD61